MNDLHGVNPVEVFDALGIGWGVHELYPNPVRQQAFLGAVDRLAVLGDSSLQFEIGANSVSSMGEELATERGGTARLSLRLFVHEVEWLELDGAPSADDLNEFFNLLAADEKATREAGGIGPALEDKGVWSIRVTQRGLLVEALDKPWEERELDDSEDSEGGLPRAARVAKMIAGGASAAEVAEAMVEQSDGEPEAIAGSFCDAFRLIYPDAEPTPGADESVHDLLTAYRTAPRAKAPVDTFAETFFLLPVEAQSRVLSDFLARREEGLHSLLLDQFGGADLADLVPYLEESSFDQLVTYARDVVDTATGSADELLPMVSAARDVKEARQTAADRIREMIEGIGGLGGATGGLAGQLRAETTATEELGERLVRLLFTIEDRPDRFARLVDALCGRISGEVQARNLEKAIVLLNVATGSAQLSAGKRQAVEEGLVELLRSDYAVFNDAAQDPETRELLGTLLGGFGEPAADHLMQRLSVEEDPATRRVLISLLVVVGSSHPDPIVRFFKAGQWYVVRNAVAIAGKIGGRTWIPHLRLLTRHDDHRVVIEALRALAPMDPDDVVTDLVTGLAHENERVRETAFLLLKASKSSSRQPQLIEALTNRAMDPARQEIADLLFELGTPEALGALTELAKKPFLISATRRDARRAARAALGSAA